MSRARPLWCATALLVALSATAAAPAGATTFIRMGLDDLVASHRTIAVAEVIDSHSYWNADGSFILTDVRLKVDAALKGAAPDGALTLTLMGGTVDDLTTLIVGGAELVPGRSYVLFLDRAALPGAKDVLTVAAHSQGAFDIVAVDGGLRAVSQANRHPLVPDDKGYTEAPGGVEGFPFDAMVGAILDLAAQPHGGGEEVER